MKTWEMKEPYPGAHIRVQMGEIYHHGIYIGNDEVVQFGLPFTGLQHASDVRVIKSHINEFLNNGFLEVRNFTKKEKKLKNSDEEIVKIALSRLGEGNYDILKNNCEHFANECVFNQKISTQVDAIHEEIRKKLERIKQRSEEIRAQTGDAG